MPGTEPFYLLLSLSGDYIAFFILTHTLISFPNVHDLQCLCICYSLFSSYLLDLHSMFSYHAPSIGSCMLPTTVAAFYCAVCASLPISMLSPTPSTSLFCLAYTHKVTVVSLTFKAAQRCRNICTSFKGNISQHEFVWKNFIFQLQ